MNPTVERFIPASAREFAQRTAGKAIETVLFRRSQNPETQRRSIYERYPKLRKIPHDKFPKNVFIIPDGNGTWARRHKLSVQMGHERGADVIVEACRDLSELSEQIPYVGIWGLSVDNLNRSPEEVNYLMGLFNRTIQKLKPDLLERKSKFVVIGNRDILEPYSELKENIEQTEKETENNEGQVIYIAIGFNGDDQDARIDKELVRMVLNGDISNPSEVTPELRKSLRDGKGTIPNADFVVRTSGQQRLSGLGWIAEGAELFFSKKLFPDFSTKDFVKSIVDYSKRKRKFGKRESAQMAA